MSWWRLPTAALGAVLAALGLFWVMQTMMLHEAPRRPRLVQPATPLALARVEPEPAAPRRQPPRPPPPPEQDVPALAPALTTGISVVVPRLPAPPRPHLEYTVTLDTQALIAGLQPAAPTPPAIEPVTGEPDADLVPLVRIPPRYPTRAALDGVEGWVKMELTITETGTVEGAKVVDAKPRRVFDRAALRAVSRWRFRPRVVDGKPVAQRAIQVVEFRLDS